MSTDPHTPSPEPFTGSSSTPAPTPTPAVGQSPASNTAASHRAGAGALTRVLTVLYALIVVPLATGLVMYGGIPWQRFVMTMGADVGGLLQFLFSPSGMPALLTMVGGLLLLVSVVATGLASSAGLLSVSLLSVFPLSLSVFPQLTATLFEMLPDSLRFASMGLFSQGVPLVLYPVLGGLGLALVIARRRPRPPLAVSLSGMVVLPVVMLVATWLLMYGYGTVLRSYAVTFGAEPIPLPSALAIVVGMVLLWLAVGATGGSPYALVLPALVLLAFSAAFLLPGFFTMLPDAMFSLTGSSLLSVVAMGTGPAVGIIWLAHTAVQFVVTSRARHQQPRPAAV